MTEKKEFNYKVSTIVLIIVTIAILIALVVFVVNYDNCVQCSEKNVSLEEPKDPYTGEILGPDKVEVGQNVHYDANLMHYNESVSNYLQWEVVSVGNGKAYFENGVLIPESPGNVIIKAKFNNFVIEKQVTIYDNASIELNMKPWVFINNELPLGINSSGVKDVEVSLYRITSTGRTEEVSFSDDGDYQIYKDQEILVQKPGNYLVVVKAKALSDNRIITNQKEIVIRKYTKRGYNQISWSNQNLIELDGNDLITAGILLKEGILITDPLIEGKTVEVDHISSAYYYIYRDPTRDDTILYQTGVTTDVGSKKQMLFAKTVASDGTVWYLLWDEFIIVASKVNPFSPVVSNDDSSSSAPAPVPAPIVIVSPSPPI